MVRTPSDLFAMRTLLGLQPAQLADLLGTRADDIKTLEKMRTHFIYEGHANFLQDMLAKVDSLILALTEEERPRPEFLFTFPVDDVFRIYEPDLASWMHYASVHQHFTSRLLSEWMALGHQPSIVVVVPTQYDQFLTVEGLTDSEESRTAWAQEHIKVIKMRPGMPNQQVVEEETPGVGRRRR